MVFSTIFSSRKRIKLMSLEQFICEGLFIFEYQPLLWIRTNYSHSYGFCNNHINEAILVRFLSKAYDLLVNATNGGKHFLIVSTKYQVVDLVTLATIRARCHYVNKNGLVVCQLIGLL